MQGIHTFCRVARSIISSPDIIPPQFLSFFFTYGGARSLALVHAPQRSCGFLRFESTTLPPSLPPSPFASSACNVRRGERDNSGKSVIYSRVRGGGGLVQVTTISSPTSLQVVGNLPRLKTCSRNCGTERDLIVGGLSIASGTL